MTLQNAPKNLYFIAIAGLFGLMAHSALAQNTTLFMQNYVATARIIAATDTVAAMFATPQSDRYYTANFAYNDGTTTDTIYNIGFRIRGNTSRSSAKKSFKISFNEFVPGQKYQNEKKINLNGQHNDPTMIREKLFYHCWQKLGMPPRQTSFVKLYINAQYMGLYTNLQEMDDSKWLNTAFGTDTGNLYKCTYPARLNYLGSNPQVYKNITGAGGARAYELKTNLIQDDYTDLIQLIALTHPPINSNFAAQIQQIFDIDNYLKTLALDVMTGNWDGYAYNKNNYFLYKNPVTNKFQYITYDTDNTFGVDFFNTDWAKRDYRNWQNNQETRPLAKAILGVPQFFDKYKYYIDTISNYITHPDTLYPIIDTYKALIQSAAQADTYRTLDYGYTMAAFNGGFTSTIDNHTPYGIKPFLATRWQYVQQQLGVMPPYATPTRFGIYPNPVQNTLHLIPQANLPASTAIYCEIYDVLGREIIKDTLYKTNQEINTTILSSGCYYLKITQPAGIQILKFVK